MATRYYGMDGEELTREGWVALFEGDSRYLARTDLPGGVWVSTVWLGIDYSWGEGPPLVFETMVFGPFDMLELDAQRYSSKEEAMLGHEELVTKWTGWIPVKEDSDAD